MMKTKTSKRLFSLLLACTMAVSVLAMTVFASAEVAQDGTDANTGSRAVGTAINTTSSILAPNFTHRVYNTAVWYQWTPGTGGDQVAMTRDSLYYDIMGSYYRDVAVVYEIGSRKCDPDYYAGKTYNSATNWYSSDTHSIEYLDGNVMRYGYDSQYPAVVRIPYWLYGPETKVPTRYDQTNFVWTHNLGDGDEIKATIEYNGEVADLEVTIPWIGYSTDSVTLNGVTFYLRTGPSKCSIKAGSDVSVVDIRFAYGVINRPE